MARPCLDCGTVTTATRCPACKRTNDQQRRPNAARRGYDGTYRKRRALLLADHPLCAICGVAPATTADHVTPVSLGGRDGPLRPACAHCNSARGNG